MPTGIVEATERLYRALFSVAVGFGLASAIWGLVIAPFDSFNHYHARSIAIGLALSIFSASLVFGRHRLWRLLQERPAALLVIAAVGVGALWRMEGGAVRSMWRPTRQSRSPP